MVKDWFWRVDGVTMPTPDDPVQITEIDLDAASTGRPESGVLHRERVRHDVMQLNMSFSRLNAQQAKLIRNAIAPAQVTVQFWLFDDVETRTMYAGDRKWEESYDSAGDPHITLQLQMSEY